MQPTDRVSAHQFELERIRQRSTRRNRWVRRGLIAFVVVLVIGVPLEVAAYRHSEALAAKEALLPVPGVHLGAAPLVVFGPEGRAAAERFGRGAWLQPAATRLCDGLGQSTGEVGVVEVGFVRTDVGDRAVLAVYCPLTSGDDQLLVAEFAPPGRELGYLVDSRAGLDAAQIVVTRADVTISRARRGTVALGGTRTVPNL